MHQISILNKVTRFLLIGRILMLFLALTICNQVIIAQTTHKTNAYVASIVNVATTKHQNNPGIFYQVSLTNWAYYTKDATLEQYQEISRDEWTIYLKNKNGDNVDLNLHKREGYINDEKAYMILAADAFRQFVYQDGNPKFETVTDQNVNRILVSNFENMITQGGVFQYLGNESLAWSFLYIKDNKFTGRETIHKEEKRHGNKIYLNNEDGYQVIIDLNGKMNHIMQMREAPIVDQNASQTQITVFYYNTEEGQHGGIYKKTGDYRWEYIQTLNDIELDNITLLQEIGRDKNTIELEDEEGHETILDLANKKRSAMWHGQTAILGTYAFDTE